MNDEEYLRLEQRALDSLDELVRENGYGLSILWRQGDGEGGVIFRRIADLMRSQGFISDPPAKPVYKKQKISDRVRWAVFRRDGFKCVMCGAEDKLTVDHIYPESKGGSSDMENLQTLCFSCNASKGAKVDEVHD